MPGDDARVGAEQRCTLPRGRAPGSGGGGKGERAEECKLHLGMRRRLRSQIPELVSR